MLSIPPATTTLLCPEAIVWEASIIVLRPLAQTLLMVVASDLTERPAPSATCRAGDWPTPACTTLPKKTSSTAAGSTFDCSRARLRATTPSSGAVTDLRAPLMEPTGVRAAATMTTSWGPL